MTILMLVQGIVFFVWGKLLLVTECVCVCVCMCLCIGCFCVVFFYAWNEISSSSAGCCLLLLLACSRTTTTTKTTTTAATNWLNALRSTSCAQWMGQTRRTPVLRSTSVGMWTTTPEWSHQSIRSICALVVR